MPSVSHAGELCGFFITSSDPFARYSCKSYRFFIQKFVILSLPGAFQLLVIFMADKVLRRVIAYHLWPLRPLFCILLALNPCCFLVMLFIGLPNIFPKLLRFLDDWRILHINQLFPQLWVKMAGIFYKDLILAEESTSFFKSLKPLCFSLDLLLEYFFSDGEVAFFPDIQPSL